MCDFLILYEEKARELESACLLKNGLEKKGYKVKIDSIYSFRKHLINAKVVIVPHLYNNYQVYEFLSKYRSRTCKVINLQYEQVLSDSDFETGYGIPKDEAKHCVIFSWGKNETERYMNNPSQKVIQTGCLAMDLNLKKYDQYYLSREDIIKSYNLDQNKKIVLFISSFSFANMSEEEVKNDYPQNWKKMLEFSQISRRNKEKTVEILKRLVSEEGYTVVYRPHPAEYEDKELESMCLSKPGFHVIRDMSIRQWIRISDYLITWYSTSIVDIYFSQKPCVVLRPEPIPDYLDISFFMDARSVDTFKALIKELNTDNDFPVEPKGIQRYYSNQIGIETLPRYVESCIKILSDDDYLYKYNVKESNRTLLNKIRSLISDIMFDIGKIINMMKIYNYVFRNNELKRGFYTHIQNELYQSKKLIKKYSKRMTNVQ